MGLKPSDDRHWTIQFGPFIIRLLDDHTRRVVHTPTKVLPISPVAQRLPPLPLEAVSQVQRAVISAIPTFVFGRFHQ